MILPSWSLVTIYKSFIRSHLDYGDIIFDQAFNKSFHDNLESIQYNASLTITGAIIGTSKEKLCQELGFESVQQRPWFRKLCNLYEIYENQSPSYLYNLIPRALQDHPTIYPVFTLNIIFSKIIFFPSVISEWNNLDISIRNSKSLSTFKTIILQFIRPSPSSTYNCLNNKGIKHITRLRLELNHLRNHKFKHGFLDSLNPICNKILKQLVIIYSISQILQMKDLSS